MRRKDKKIFIFSDECGKWSGYKEDKFYVRCWIKIDEENYYRLNGFCKEKNIYNFKKALLRKNSDEILEFLFNKIEFKILFTITNLKEFYERKISVRDEILNSILETITKLEKKISKNYIKNKIPKKIKDSINYILFLNIYERYHIENAIEYLCNESSTYVIRVDNPQFNNQDYEELINEVGSRYKNNIKIEIKIEKENKENAGISLCDGFAYIIKNILEKDDKKGIEFYKKYLITVCEGGNFGIPGINKVFYPIKISYGKVELLSEETNLISKLKEKLLNGEAI